MNRREFLASSATGVTTAAGVLASAAPSNSSAAAQERARTGAPRKSGCIDVNVHLSHWPLRRVAGDESPAALIDRLREAGVTEAWAGSLDGLLHKDLASVNARLADACGREVRNRCSDRGFLRPFGSVNPAAPGWEDDLERCARDHGMPGVRLHPNYHGYALDHPAFRALLQGATDRRLIVQLSIVMEDERMMHPLLRMPPVDVSPLAEAVRGIPGLRLVLLNALRTVPPIQLRRLIDAGDVSVEIATQEGVGGVGHLLAQVPTDRVLFGSHAPLFYVEAAALKLRESEIEVERLAAIRFGNARRLLAAA